MSIKRPPLLSDEEIIDETWVPDMSSWEPAGAYEAGMHWARRYYEAARAKDAELIQIAVDMAHERVIGVSEKMRDLVYKKETLLLAMASAAGFKPTDQ